MYKKVLLSLVFVFLFVLFLLPAKTADASTLYLSPGSKSVAPGSSFTVQVRLNTGGEAVNAVSAVVNYPADKLTANWTSYSSSAFGIQAQDSFGGGTVKMARGNISGVSGDVNVGSINFTAKAAGSATVYFAGGSKAPRASDSSDSLNLAGSGGGVYAIAAGAASSNSGTGGSKTSTPSPTPVGLNLTEVNVINIATNSATITWQTDRPADSTVNYGLYADKYFLDLSDDTLATTHSLTLDSSFFVPGTLIHFKVISKDSKGILASGTDTSFRLKGYTIRIKIVDSNGRPIPNLKVLLYSDPLQAVTDKNGEAVFENVPPGEHLVDTQINGKESTSKINVQGNNNFAPQSFNVPVNSTASLPSLLNSNKLPYFIAVIVAEILIFIGFVVFVLKKSPPTISR